MEIQGLLYTLDALECLNTVFKIKSWYRDRNLYHFRFISKLPFSLCVYSSVSVVCFDNIDVSWFMNSVGDTFDTASGDETIMKIFKCILCE